MGKSQEYVEFDKAMSAILRADPEKVKARMEADKKARATEAELSGKRGRGRPPKHTPSGRALSGKD